MTANVEEQGKLRRIYGLRQRYVSSADLFKPILEKVIRETEVNKEGAIFNRTLQ
jgi:hypothetical protein